MRHVKSLLKNYKTFQLEFNQQGTLPQAVISMCIQNLNISDLILTQTDRLAQLLSVRYRCGRSGFDSRDGPFGTVSPTARHRCDVSSELCCLEALGTKPRRRTPPLVTGRNTASIIKIYFKA